MDGAHLYGLPSLWMNTHFESTMRAAMSTSL
jgi:hypothetical protein